MKQKQLGLAILLGLLLLAALPHAASAGCTFGTLAPSSEACLDAIYVSPSATMTGSGHLHTLRFRIYWSATGAPGTFTVVDDFEAVSTTYLINSTSFPGKIPGYYYVCAKRPSRFANGTDFDLCLDTP
jgi:hypothetical protein